MKALSLWQPWASLMALGDKAWETRGWSTAYRGPIAIHAAKKWTSEIREYCLQEPFRACLANRYATLGEIPRGCIVAIGELVEIVPTSNIVAWSEREKLNASHQYTHRVFPDKEMVFGNYGPDRFAWHIKVTEFLEQPIPAVGMQALFEWRRAA